MLFLSVRVCVHSAIRPFGHNLGGCNNEVLDNNKMAESESETDTKPNSNSATATATNTHDAMQCIAEAMQLLHKAQLLLGRPEAATPLEPYRHVPPIPATPFTVKPSKSFKTKKPKALKVPKVSKASASWAASVVSHASSISRALPEC